MKTKFNISYLLLLLFILSISGFSQTLHTKEAPLPCVNKSFSVFAYIVIDSLEKVEFEAMKKKILQAFTQVNDYFSPICMRFDVCEWKAIPNYQYYHMYYVKDSLWDELLVKYHHNRRINMYFTGKMRRSLAAGFTDGVVTGDEGGIAIISPTSETIAHELGHFFGLPHTFSRDNGEELVDGSNCKTAGDKFCDTPADPYNEADQETEWTKNCRFIYEGLDPNGDYYRPDVGNIMSYYHCPCGFSREQYIKMANTWLKSMRKNW